MLNQIVILTSDNMYSHLIPLHPTLFQPIYIPFYLSDTSAQHLIHPFLTQPHSIVLHSINKPYRERTHFQGKHLCQNSFVSLLKRCHIPQGANSFLLELTLFRRVWYAGKQTEFTDVVSLVKMAVYLDPLIDTNCSKQALFLMNLMKEAFL